MTPFAERVWRLAHDRSLTLGPVARLMGILNVTPDSFSDGGRLATREQAVAAALRMVDEGASIIDVGGESTRPDADAVSAEEELERVVPVIEAVRSRSDVILSVDTYKAAVANAAIEAGAHIVNDVTGLKADPRMAPCVARHRAGLVAMHNSRPVFRPARPDDPVDDQRAFAAELERDLEVAGIANDQLVFDPGIGFGKEAKENLNLLSRLAELTAGDRPLLLGTSRKRFIGAVTGREAAERDAATAATSALGRRSGVAVFRVHDIPTNRDALLMADAIIQAGGRR